MQNIRTAIAVATFMSLTAFASAQEKGIQRSDLPPAVEKALQTQLGRATIKGFSKEMENGHLYYEAALIVDGHSKDVQFDPQGNITEIEEEVAANTLPTKVKAGLEAKAGQGKLVKVETLMKRGTLVAYEAQISTAGKRSEIQVGPDGKPLDHEE